MTDAGRRVTTARVTIERARPGKKTERKRVPPKARGSRPTSGATAVTPDVSRIAAALRAWRLEEARHARVPAFRILTDRVLTAIASARPESIDQLLDVHGMGVHGATKYGEPIVGIVRAAREGQ